MPDEYYLLIEPVITQKSRRFLLLFKPKENIQYEPFNLQLKVTNKGSAHFPGGIAEKIDITHQRENVTTQFKNILIPQIAINENVIVNMGLIIALSEGVVSIKMNIKANDNKPIKYYQRSKFLDQPSELLDTNHWEDFLITTSRNEINQRYTNYLLIILTFVIALFGLLNLFI